MPWCCEGDNSMILDISDAQIANVVGLPLDPALKAQLRQARQQ
jgi:hypothetical protein